MNRRSFLATGAASATAFALAGCLGSFGSDGSADEIDGPRNDDSLPQDDDPSDGYPPAFDRQPDERSIDVDSFDTETVEGRAVPLAPLEAAYYWYARSEARFVDARGQGQYDRSHLYGAVLSPAPDGAEGDPVADWPTDDRIVCYCGCPHHLSSMRAASLLDAGYESVYVIDEGFFAWQDANYPLAGADVDARPAVRRIRGRTDAGHAGEMALAVHEPSDQREAAPIGPDGGYELALRFADVDDASRITVETPAYRLTGTLGELTAEVVDPS